MTLQLNDLIAADGIIVGASEPFRKRMTIKVNPVSIVSFFHALYDPWVFSTLLGKDFLLLPK